MNKHTNGHIDPLAEKFRNFKPSSPRSSFASFERTEQGKNRKWLHLEITALLVSLLIVMASNLARDGRFLFNPEDFTGYDTNTATALKQVSGIPESGRNSMSEHQGLSEPELFTVPETMDQTYHEDGWKNDNASANSIAKENGLPHGPEPGDGPEGDKPVRKTFEPSIPVVVDIGSKNLSRPITSGFHMLPKQAEPLLKEQVGIPPIQGIDPDSVPAPPTLFRGRNAALLLSPALTVMAGFNQTNQLIKSASEAALYVPAGYNNYLKDATGSTINTWYTLKFEWPLLTTTLASAGIGYEQFAVRGNYSFSVDSFPVFDLDGTIAGYIHLPDTAQGVHVEERSERTFTYLHVPLGVQTYFPVGKRWLLASGLDISMDYLLTSTGNILDESDYTSVRSLSEVSMRKFNMGFNARAGLLYSLTKHWAVGGVVSYDRKLFSDQQKSYYKAYNQGFGMALTCRYQILK